MLEKLWVAPFIQNNEKIAVDSVMFVKKFFMVLLITWIVDDGEEEEEEEEKEGEEG